MPRNARKRKASEEGLSSNKRPKLQKIHLPTPTHIHIKENTKVSYYFSDINQTEIFLQGLNKQLTHQGESIQLKKPNRLCLTSEHMNAWLGLGAHNKLLNIQEYFCIGDFMRLANELDDIKSTVANQAALLINKNRESACLLTAISNSKDFPSWQVIPFLKKLNKETLIQGLIYVDEEDRCGFSTLLKYLLPDAAMFVLNQLLPEDWNQLILTELWLHAEYILPMAARYQPPEVFNTLVNLLSDELLNCLALEKDEDGDVFLHHIMDKLPSSILCSLIDRLTPETCDFIALLRQSCDLLLIEDIAAHSPSEVYQLFEKKLTFETKMNTVFPMDMDLDNTNEQYPHIAFSSTSAPKAAVKMISTALQHPQELKKYAQRKSQLQLIEFFDSGSSYDIWSDIAESMVNVAPPAKKRRIEIDTSSKFTQIAEKRPEKDFLNKMIKQGWQFLRLQGRTVLFQNKKGIIRAVKIQKLNEPKEDLSKEFKVTTYLRQNAKELGLKSQFPTSRFVDTVVRSRLSQWLQKILPESEYSQIINWITKDRYTKIYIYDVDPQKCDYFTYLHALSLSDSQFKEANYRIVHDLFTLLKQGIVFPQLADIFHNLEHVEIRADAGRYMVLVNILRNFGHRGSGRITAWQQAVEYPNIRASGLADLGDCASINDYIGDGFLIEKFFSETKKIKGSRAGNFVLANLMAEYQFILFLNAGRRGHYLTKIAKETNQSPSEINLIWLNLAQQVMDNCIQSIVILLNQKESEVAKLLHAVVHVERLSQQMHYWMTEEYIADLMQNKIRDGIYEQGTKVVVNIDDFRQNTFNALIGCSINGVDQDLGPVNGQEPIKEANKLFYWMITKVFESYNLTYLTMKDLHRVTSEKDILQSESLRHKLFTHLPQKQYHKLQQTLCEERLKQKKLPYGIREQVKIEAKAHKKEYAVSVIQSFWRNHRKPQMIDSEVLAEEQEEAAQEMMF